MESGDRAGKGPVITAYWDGKAINRHQVKAWEARRLAAVWTKLTAKIGKDQAHAISKREDPTIPLSDLEQQRNALTALKLAIGHDQMKRLFAAELAFSARAAKIMTTLAGGKRKISAIEIHTDRGSAAQFVDWFFAVGHRAEESAMIHANPDHYVVTTLSDGRQEVVETTGGAPAASHFFVHFGDFTGVEIPRDGQLPLAFGGRCCLPDGTMIGSALHQFRENPAGGWFAKLSIEFPFLLPPWLIRAHRWHLACEFSNWAEAAYAERHTTT